MTDFKVIVSEDFEFAVNPESGALTDQLDHNMTEMELRDLDARLVYIVGKVRDALNRKHTRERHREVSAVDRIVRKAIRDNRIM